MINILRNLWVIGVLCLLGGGMLTGCKDDVEVSATRPSVEENEEGRVTSFTLTHEQFSLPEETETVIIALIGSGGETECYTARVEREHGESRYHMSVPAPGEIADGDYIMTMRHADGKSISGRLLARFEEGKLASVKIIIPKYMLDGSGTADDPYLIQSDNDFSTFLINLWDDTDVYGAGLCFRQTADVIAPDQSTFISGRGYWGAPFAGCYDGGSHAIRGLYYHGASSEDSDSGIGLFTTLMGTATVENLKLEGVSMSGLYKEAGVIAGKAAGDVALSHISVAGHIEDAYAMGGLIGSVASGTLTVTDAELRMTVKGGSDLGGIVGKVCEGAALVADGVTTPDYHFSISGNHSVGGVVGRSLGSASISGVRLEHKVSGEDSDVSIIYGVGDGIGGIIGTVTAEAGEHRLKSCYVKCPVGGAHANVGGILGQIYSAKSCQLDDCRMYSVVTGVTSTGGFIGKADIPSGADGVRIAGEDMSCRIVADDADAKVTGQDNTGGFAGWWRGPLTLDSKLRINLPVSGVNQTGGAFGGIYDSTVDLSKIVFGNSAGSATTMKVTGTLHTGGMIGSVERSTVTGNNRFEYVIDGTLRIVPAADTFTPNFDGVVNGATDTGGLIGNIKDSTIKYLNSAATVTGNKNVGGVIGYALETANKVDIEDCTFKGKLNCPDSENIGGVIGCIESQKAGVVHDCINYSEVNGAENTGGIIGCINKSDPKDSKKHVLEVKWCANKGAVDGRYHVAGVVGYHRILGGEAWQINLDYPNVNITNCMNAADITATGNSTSTCGVGGIVGFSGAFICVALSSNHGSIMGNGQFHGIGGIAGSLGTDPSNISWMEQYRNLDVYECINTGRVNADNSSSQVGGILGFQEEGDYSNVHDCLNSGDVPCDQKNDTGGIVGYVDHMTDIRRCVNRGMVSHGNAMIGTHKSGSLFDHSDLYFLEGTGKNWPSAKSVAAANFNQQSSFPGLNFSTTWTITSDGPLPRNNPWSKP